MKHYCITDSLETAARAARRRVDMIQIRAKTLSARELLALSRKVVQAAKESRVLVNTRFDVAIAAGAQGVHLPSHSIEPFRIRQVAPAGFLIGVSCHTIEEVERAQREGASFVVFGPVFPTASKPDAVPVGLEVLRQVCARVQVPVYALGGVTEANAQSCIDAGAAGVAGISLFRA